MAGLLGFSRPVSGLHPDQLGYVAQSGRGRRGWQFIEELLTIDAIEQVGGRPAVDQLRRLARACLERLWAFRLLLAEDLDAVRRTTVYARPAEAPKPALSFESYSLPPAPKSAVVNRTLTSEAFKL